MDEIDFVYIGFLLGMLIMSVVYYRDWKSGKYNDSKDWFHASLVGLFVILIFQLRDMFFDPPFLYNISISIIGIISMLGTAFYAWWKNR